jgi:hypothetical protein
MRTVIVFLIILATPAPTTDLEAYDMALKIIRFETAYNRFFRKFFGCPLDPSVFADKDTCKFPSQSIFDARDFASAREAAKELFDLDDRRPGR